MVRSRGEILRAMKEGKEKICGGIRRVEWS